MENALSLILIIGAMIGWYMFINELINICIFQNTKVDENIKLKIIVENNENSIEFLVRKLGFLQNKLASFQDIEIIDNTSSDQTYEILEKIQKQYPNLKIRKML